MEILPDAPAGSLHPFLTRYVEPGATVITDGWMGYHGIAGLGYAHVRRSQRAARARGEDPGKLLPGVHRVASLAKRWLLGTHQGSVEDAHLQSYLDEFCFRFNRRRSRSRGLVFYRVLELAVGHDPVRYRHLIAHPEHKAKPPEAPGQRGIRRASSARGRPGHGEPFTWDSPVRWIPPSELMGESGRGVKLAITHPSGVSHAQFDGAGLFVPKPARDAAYHHAYSV